PDTVLAVELRERHLTGAVRVLEMHARPEREERGHSVGARDREAAGARDRDTTDDVGIGLHAEAFGGAPEEGLVVPIAARVEADVPADRAHVPELRRA